MPDDPLLYGRVDWSEFWHPKLTRKSEKLAKINQNRSFLKKLEITFFMLIWPILVHLRTLTHILW